MIYISIRVKFGTIFPKEKRFKCTLLPDVVYLKYMRLAFISKQPISPLIFKI